MKKVIYCTYQYLKYIVTLFSREMSPIKKQESKPTAFPKFVRDFIGLYVNPKIIPLFTGGTLSMILLATIGLHIMDMINPKKLRGSYVLKMHNAKKLNSNPLPSFMIDPDDKSPPKTFYEIMYWDSHFKQDARVVVTLNFDDTMNLVLFSVKNCSLRVMWNLEFYVDILSERKIDWKKSICVSLTHIKLNEEFSAKFDHAFSIFPKRFDTAPFVNKKSVSELSTTGFKVKVTDNYVNGLEGMADRQSKKNEKSFLGESIIIVAYIMIVYFAGSFV